MDRGARLGSKPVTPSGLCSRRTHLSRRTLLGGGGASLFLSSLAGKLARASESKRNDPQRPLSVILLWLEGGNSQLETFDPHPGTAIGGDVKAIGTTIPGVTIADTLPQTAEQMHLASLVRSVTGKEGDHERAVYNIKNGYRPDPTLVHPSIGAILCQADQGRLDIPRHISILPGQWPARGGYLGAAFDAFKVDDPVGPVRDIERPVSQQRYRQRIDDLYEVLEPQFSRGRLVDLERSRTLHRTATDSALAMMSSEQLSAFDVTLEPKSELQSFGGTPFGRGCLAAARLVEAGTRCVEVTLSGWDSHVSNHTLQSAACETLDPALASLLRRLDQRDLLETTLVVCGGEFGRTPTINPAEGRDHWPHGFSTLLAGCGIRRGGMFGATAPEPKLGDDRPLQNVENPVTVADLHATILTSLGVDPLEELDTPVGRPMKRSEGTPIRRLVREA